MLVSSHLAGKLLSKGTGLRLLKQKILPEIAEEMIEKIISVFSNSVETKSGQFGAMMEVGLKNDGPITFVLQAKNGQLIN